MLQEQTPLEAHMLGMAVDTEELQLSVSDGLE